MKALREIALVETKRQVWRTLAYVALVNLPLLDALQRVASGRTEASVEARFFEHWYRDVSTLGFANVVAALVAMLAGVDLFAREWREGYGALYRTLAVRTGAVALVRTSIAWCALLAGAMAHVVARAVFATTWLGVPANVVDTTRVMGALAFYLTPYLLAGALLGLVVRPVPAMIATTVFWFLAPAWATAHHPWLQALINAGGIFEGVYDGSAWFVPLWLAAAAALGAAIAWRSGRRQIA